MLLNRKPSTLISLYASVNTFFKSASETNTESWRMNIRKQVPQNDIVNIAYGINSLSRDHFPIGFTSNNHDLITKFTNHCEL